MKRINLLLGGLAVAVLSGGCAYHGGERPAAAPLADSPAQTLQEEKKQPPAPLSQDVLYRLLVAEVAMHRGNFGVTLENYMALANETRDLGIAERATRLAVYAHDDTKALEAAQLWAALDPKNIEAKQVLIAFHVRNGQLDEALKGLEDILAVSGGGNENGYVTVAGLLSRQQDKQVALTVMERLVAAHPNDSSALLALSSLALRAGDLTKAESAIKRVIELKPDMTEAIIQRARIIVMQGKNAEALAYLEGVTKKHPKDVSLRLAYARQLVEEKQTEKAIEQFKKVVAQAPDNPNALFMLGILSLQLDRLDEGENFLLRLNKNEDYVSETSYYLGRIAEDHHKDRQAAIAWYSKVDRGESYIDAHIRIAAILAEGGDLEQSRRHLHSLNVEGPGQLLRIYLAEGEILRRAEHYQEAIDILTSALEEIPDNTDLLYARAMVAEKIDRVDMLEQDLKHILEREPDNAEALNALGYTLADRTTRYSEALEYIKRALELQPQSHYILDSMGWVHYRLGNYQEAVKYLRRAMESNQDPELAAHLTEVLWVMGDQQGAREVWKHAVDATPGNKLLLDVMQRLDHQ